MIQATVPVVISTIIITDGKRIKDKAMVTFDHNVLIRKVLHYIHMVIVSFALNPLTAAYHLDKSTLLALLSCS